MLSRFNEKLLEFESNEFNILNHFQQKSNQFIKPTDTNKFHLYNTLNNEYKVNWENILNPPGNGYLQPSSPIEPLNYKDPIYIDKQENLKLPGTKGDEDEKKDVKKEEKKDDKTTQEPIKQPDQPKTIQTLKPQRLKSGSSKVRWSLSDHHDDDSLDLSIFEHENHNRLQLIFKFVFRLKTVLLILSVIGLVYQTLELSETYFRYPTIVDVIVEQNDKVIVPSITICTPMQIMPSNLEKMFSDRPEVRRVLSRFDADEKMKTKEKQAKKIDYLRRYLQSSYLSRVTVNLSTYDELSVQENKFVDSCYLSVLNSSDAEIRLPCRNFSRPTVTFTSNEKCFTYFGVTNKQIESIDDVISFDEDGSAATAQISVVLRLNVDFDDNYDISLPSLLYIHSSNEIMAKSNGFALESNKKYNVFYWRTVSERLPPLYCREYQSSILYPQSQIDCVNRCSTEHTYLYCRCLMFKPPLRLETVPLSARICPQLDGSFLRSCKRMLQGLDPKACRSRCTSACIEEAFDYSVTTSDISPEEVLKISGSINQSGLIEIHVTRKLKPDVFYKQKYQLEFEQYFSNFCSLLGFWLGITVLTFYDQLKKNTIRLYRLLCYVKTKIKHKKRRVKPKSRNI
uniref:Uncharacterized protein n=1 Tax=Tetranychus urticae TaxID=32264 RepID=T1K0W9_TETUR